MRKNTINKSGSSTLPSLYQIHKQKGPSESPKQTMKEFESKLQEHQQFINKNGQIIQKLTAAFEVVKSQLRQRKQQILELSNVKNQLTKKVKSYKQDYSRLKEKCIQDKLFHETQIGELKSRFQRQIQTLSQSQSSLNEEIKNKNNQIKRLSQSNEALAKKLRQAKFQLDQKAHQAQRYQKSIRSHLQKSFELGQQIQQLTVANQALKKQLSDSKEKVSELKKTIALQAQSKSSIEQKIRTFNSNMDRNKSMIEQILQQKNRISIRLQEKDKQITGCQNLLKDRLKQIRQLQSKLKENEIRQAKSQSTISQLQSNLLKQSEYINSFNKKSASDQEETREKASKIGQIISQIVQAQKTILPSLKCMYCKESLKESVTIIPCGHCFCLGCKKGYSKQCFKCGAKGKVQAVYRNQLMDDIMKMMKELNKVREALQAN